MINNYSKDSCLDNCLLFFCNTNCYPCELLEKELNQLDVLIYKVNIQENLEVAHSFDITSIPTILFMKNNNKVFSFNGVRSLKDINRVLEHFNMI